MNTWFWLFLVPKSPVTVFFLPDLQDFGLLGLRGLPWISQAQSTGLPSIFLRAQSISVFCISVFCIFLIQSHQPPQEELQAGEGEEAEEEDLVLTLRKFPRTPQPWISLGSEVEVEEENVIENRPKVRRLLTKALSLLCVLVAPLSKNNISSLHCQCQCSLVLLLSVFPLSFQKMRDAS